VTGKYDTFDRDTISNVHLGQSCVTAAYDPSIFKAPVGLTIANDKIYDCGSAGTAGYPGVDVSSTGTDPIAPVDVPHVITNNWIFENSGPGVRLRWNSSPGGPPARATVDHNVIADNCATTASSTACQGQTSFETATNNSAYRFNTIAFPYAPSGDSTPPYNFYLSSLNGGGDVLEDNCWWKPAGADHTWVLLTDGAGHTITNTRPTTADPQFPDRTNPVLAFRNYSIPSSNPCYSMQPSGAVGGGGAP
jgi:hypothetical protein